MKKILYTITFIFLILPSLVNASGIALVKVGNNYYDNLEDAIRNASSKDIIYLITNIELNETININKTININLNGNEITAKEKVFLIEGGSLHLSGSGKVKETEPYNGAIVIKGSQNKENINYSTLKVDKEVTLEGWSGISIQHTNQKSYGVLINFQGKINAINDIKGDSGIGIYINGNIKNEENVPIVNLNNGSTITSTGVGIYIAGESLINIESSNINGKESAISIKSGTLNIKDGYFYCDGIDNTPTSGHNNGVKPSGTTIQIESNDGYKGNIKINLSGGIFKSKNSHAIYEYIGRGNNTQVKEINITGGTFDSKKNVFSFSESFTNQHNHFISGGKYSTNPVEYLKEDYIIDKIDNYYTVLKSTMKEDNINITPTTNKLIYILVSFIIIFITLFLSKNKILKIIKFKKQN